MTPAEKQRTQTSSQLMKISETPLQHTLKSETAWEGEKKTALFSRPQSCANYKKCWCAITTKIAGSIATMVQSRLSCLKQKLLTEVHICKEGWWLFKSPVGWHKAFNTQWQDKKKQTLTVGESVLMCLTVASGLVLIRYWLQPSSLTAIQSTRYDCALRVEQCRVYWRL